MHTEIEFSQIERNIVGRVERQDHKRLEHFVRYIDLFRLRNNGARLVQEALCKPFLLIRVQYTVLLYIVELDYIYYYGGYRYCIHSMLHI